MKLFLRKIIAGFLSAIILSSTVAVLPMSASADSTKYEFESGVNVGVSAEKSISGYSGTGYVYLKSAGNSTQVTVNVAEAGAYEIDLCYLLPTSNGEKMQDLYINGENVSTVSFAVSDKFSVMNAGSFQLKAGSNTIKIVSSWGWTIFDYLTVEKTVLPELTADNTLSDTSHTDSAQGLMNYLCDTYGNNIISGQQELYGKAGETEFDYIYNTTGKYPAIRGFDYMNWSQAQN